MGTPTLEDPFAKAPLHYRHEGDAYVLWSVGPDGKDEQGKGDDLVLRSAPEQTPATLPEP